jgi:dUTP pyrophosphatase
MAEVSVKVIRLRPHEDGDLELPEYMTESSAGMDIPAAVTEETTLAPGEIRLIPTGFAIALPEGFEAQVRPRSGLAVKFGLTVVNSPGTIDADYRGEVKVALINLGPDSFTIRRGDRVAQMVVGPVSRVRWDEVAELPETGRGPGGFGHTGRTGGKS